MTQQCKHQCVVDIHHAEKRQMFVLLWSQTRLVHVMELRVYTFLIYVPHALIIFQDKRVDRSLTEVQPTSGMGKVHIRRKRQSMVMARALTPPRLPPKRAQK